MEQLSFSECRRGYIEFGYETCREMENISTGLTIGEFVTIQTEGSTVARLQSRIE